MTRYDTKISDLKNLLKINYEKLESSFANYASNSETRGKNIAEPALDLLEASLRTQEDIEREKRNLADVETLFSRLTSTQTKKRVLIQRRNLLILSLESLLFNLSEEILGAYHRGEEPWVGKAQIFAVADRYQTKYKELVEEKELLKGSTESPSFWASVIRTSKTFFNYIKLKSANHKRKETYLNLGLALVEDPQFDPHIPSSEGLEKLRSMRDTKEALDQEEREIRTQLETYGAQTSPARRIGEISRTLQMLQARLTDLRIRRGKALWEYQESNPGATQEGDKSHIEIIRPLVLESKSLGADLVRYQAAADIQILEERNQRLAEKIQNFESQISKIQGNILGLQSEIMENQSQVQEKILLRGEHEL